MPERSRGSNMRSWILAGWMILIVGGTAWGQLEKADSLREAGKHAEAVAVYKEVMAKEPDHPKALYGIGFSLTELGRAEAFSDSLWAARQHLEKLVVVAPGVPEYHYLNGYSAYLLAPRAPSFTMVLQNKAASELQRSIDGRPNHWDSWFYLGKVLHAQGKMEKAVEVFTQAITLQPDRLETYPDLALVQFSLGRHDACIETTRKLLEKSPGYHFGHKIIGDALAAKSDLKGAEVEYLAGARAEPLNAVWADALWLLFQRTKDMERAGQVFTDLLKTTPGAEAPRKFLALSLNARKLPAEASTHFRVLTQSFPQNVWYHQWLAEAEEAAGREEEAVAAYLETLRLKPDWSNPFIPLRRRFDAAKAELRYKDALDLLRRVSACNPHPRTHAWVMWDISECSRQLGDVEGTIEALKKAMDLDPIEPRFHNSMGLFLRTLKRYDEAMAEFKKALEIEPGYMYTLENLAATNQMVHRDEEARKWFEEGLVNAQEQHAWAGDDEVKNEREFDIFKFTYFLHEMETLEKRKKK
ncbi:MAG: tetratricopeptide repeat protein [Planctomycetota bacterium]